LKVVEEMTMSGEKNFDRSTLEHALAELGRRAFAAGRTVPQNMLQPKTRLGLEEIFANLDIDRAGDQIASSSSSP
jgi:hypothetical protein